jgi:uncharacterized membrane protein YeiH
MTGRQGERRPWTHEGRATWRLLNTHRRAIYNRCSESTPWTLCLPSIPLVPLSHALTAIEVAAIIAFALSGLLAAARARMDAVGVCVVTGMAAFGGGTLRDVLLDRRPFFWVEHSGWLWVLLLLCVAAMLFLRARHFAVAERAIQWADAVGLGLFTASGAQVSIDAGMPAIVAVLMGMVTAVFGGVLRDIVCNEIPTAFRDHRPYAVCSFCGGWVLIAAHAWQAPAWLALFGAAATATVLRAIALATGFTLPQWSHGPPEG